MTSTTKSRPKSRTRSSSSTSSPSGERSPLDQFVGFCAQTLRLEDGRPLVVEDFQRQMLADLFDGVRETVILLPKKNGKSTILGALALFEVLSVPDAEIIIVAAAREQAGIMLRQVQGFIRRSAALQERLDVKKREIEHRRHGGRIRVLASDVDTVDGVIPTLVLVDELHRHRSPELYGILRDGLGPRDGRMATISTAGSRSDSPLGVLRKHAHELPSFRRHGAYNYARTAGFAFHEWALRPEEPTGDVAVVKSANPASWQTEAELRARLPLAQGGESPTTTPWQWLRFACGIWTDVEEPWIDPEVWDACAGVSEWQEAERLFGGVDIGVKKDASAIALVGWRDEKLHVFVEIHTPTPGRPVAVAEVRERIGELNGAWPIEQVGFDPWSFRESAEELLERGVPMVEYPVTNTRMVPASEKLRELVAAKRLVHDGNPQLRAHVLAAISASTERGERISKRRSREPIDGIMALTYAMDLAVLGKAGPGKRGVKLF